MEGGGSVKPERREEGLQGREQITELGRKYQRDLILETGHLHLINQWCGSMTFWCGSGSGSADPCLWLIDPDSDLDPDPAIFVIDLQDANKKQIFLKSLSAYFFLKVYLHQFSKIISKKSHKRKGPKTYGSDGSKSGFRSGSATRP
jgi:hypothetical protein